MIIGTLSPETELYHDTLDMAEEYDIDVLYDVMVKTINDIEKAKIERNARDQESLDEYRKHLAEERELRRVYDAMVKTNIDTEKAKIEQYTRDQIFLEVYMKFNCISCMYSTDVLLEVAREIIKGVDENKE